MNYEEISMPLITIETYKIKSFLYGMMHTILFNRIINKQYTINTINCDILNISYIQIQNNKLFSKLKNEIDAIYKHIKHNTVQILHISLFIKKKKKGLFLTHNEIHVWEQWTIPFKCVNYYIPNIQYTDIQEYFQTMLYYISQHYTHINYIINYINLLYFTIDYSNKPRKRKLSWKQIINDLTHFSPPQFNIS